jgi:hypothetical protein
LRRFAPARASRTQPLALLRRPSPNIAVKRDAPQAARPLPLTLASLIFDGLQQMTMESFDEQKLCDSYSGTLSRAWESYIKIIDLLLGFAGATGLVFVASIKVTDWTSLPNQGLYFFSRRWLCYVGFFGGSKVNISWNMKLLDLSLPQKTTLINQA